MSSSFPSESSFEALLERALVDRSQTVLAPRRLFERMSEQLGEQGKRSILAVVFGSWPSRSVGIRNTAIAVTSIVAILLVAFIATSNGYLSRSNSDVATAPSDLKFPDIPPVGASRDVWTTVAGMNHPRQRHGSVSLNDDRVLIFGGFDTDGPVMSTEIFNPELNIWTAAGDFPYELPNYETPVVLNDGRVLVVGGSHAQQPDPMFTWYLRDSALFDPATNEWELVDDILSFGRRDAKAGLLPDGRVLLFGGTASRIPNFSQEELFDPETKQWKRVTDEPNFPSEYRDWADVVRGNRIVFVSGWGRLEIDDGIPGDMVISLNPSTRWIGLDGVDANFGNLFITRLSNDRIMIGTGSLRFGATGDVYFLDQVPMPQIDGEGSGLESLDRELRALVTADGYVESVAEWWQSAEDPETQAMRGLNHIPAIWTVIGAFPSPGLDEFSVTQLEVNRILITGGTIVSGRYSDASFILQLPPG